MRHGRRLFAITFLLPAVAVYAVFVVSPYLQAFQVSTTNWRGLSPKWDYVGPGNFQRLLSDEYFWNALKHNGILLAVLPVATIVLGLFFASMLNIHGVRFGAVYRIVYFFPQVLSVAIIGVLWREMYAPNGGLVNGFLRAVGLDSLTRTWLGDADVAFWAVLFVMVWSNVGFYVVLFGAAMSSIPREIYEAALLDGAGRRTTLLRITVPLLWDTIQVAWVYLAIVALDAFALVQIITNGGPEFSTDVVGLRLYNTAFGESKFGYASAIGVAMFFVTLTVAIASLRLTRRERIEY
ncbi:sugar ABC transporter permease [Dactylosporangium sp. NPDC049140]|jgi:N-acetylglucosamine transport system permease protein|uniref:carbohydrate ABC transporter permease n=1 Tax=Dactylosporangium sp. NPDC049140 TaxID=3155647 RepID=UPI0033E0A147